MNIIAMNGFKRSGKGEAANALDRLVEGRVKQVGFADKLKILGARTLGFTDRTGAECIELMDDAKEAWNIDIWRQSSEPTAPPLVSLGGITGRQYLQNLGTEARKVFGADFWVDQVLPGISGPEFNRADWQEVAQEKLGRLHGTDIDWLVITDLRFENEAQRVLDLGGEVWRVTRPGLKSDGHDSEIPLPDHLVSRSIPNTGTLTDLQWTVRARLVGYLAERS